VIPVARPGPIQAADSGLWDRSAWRPAGRRPRNWAVCGDCEREV